MMKRNYVILVAALSIVGAFSLSAQDNPLDWNSPRLMALGMTDASDESPYADTLNPAASAGTQRTTLDLSVMGIPGFTSEKGFGAWVNAGASFPSNLGVFSVSGRFATAQFPSLDLGTFGGLNVSFAKDILDNLYFGLGLGFQIGQSPDPTNLSAGDRLDWGLGLDLGIVSILEKTGFLKDFRWGLAIRGLGKQMLAPAFNPYSGTTIGIPPNFTIGLGTQFKFIKTDEVVLGFNADVDAVGVYRNLQANAGLDLRLLNTFNLQVSYAFDLNDALKNNIRPVPLSFGFGFTFASKPKADAKDQSILNSSEYRPSVSITPIRNGLWAIGAGLNVPLGVIDKKPPTIDIGVPSFDPAPDPLAPDSTSSDPDANAGTLSQVSTSDSVVAVLSGSLPAETAFGGGAKEKPSTQSASGGTSAPASGGASQASVPGAGFANGTAYISPNLDGIQDTLSLPVTIKDDRYITSYALIIYDDAGNAVKTIRNKEVRPETTTFGSIWQQFIRTKQGLKIPPALVWDGTGDDGNVVADGTYTYVIEVSDDNNNVGRTQPKPVVVDTKPADLSLNAPALSFAPGGDRPVLTINQSSGPSLSPSLYWTGAVVDSNGKVIRNWTWRDTLPAQATWDGTTSEGVLAPDGIYSFRLHTSDASGNRNTREIDNILLLNQQTPVTLSIDNGWFSPNGDGIKDTVNVEIDANAQVKVDNYTAVLQNSKGAAVRTYKGSDALPKAIVVDGKDDSGKVLPEDTYKLVLTALYVNGNNPSANSPDIVLDLTKPQANVSSDTKIFSPNSDGFKDVVTLAHKTSEEPLWEAEILDGGGKLVRKFSWRGHPDTNLIWDGRNDSGTVVADGDFTYQVHAVDMAGNFGQSNPVVLRVDNRATSATIRADVPAFAPGTASKVKSVTLALSQKVPDGIDSYQVRIHPASAGTGGTTGAAFGTQNASDIYVWKGNGNPPPSFAWDGKKSDGTLADDGSYVAEYDLVYQKGDRPTAFSSPIQLDTHTPQVKVDANNLVFSPDGSSTKTSVTFTQTTSQEDLWTGTISDKDGKTILTRSWPGTAPATFAWDGGDNNGNKAPDGAYTYSLSATDAAGNTGKATISAIRIDTQPVPVSVLVAGSAFSPNGDGVKDVMEFTPKLDKTTDVKGWKLQISPAAGGSARTIVGTDSVPQKLLWDGKTDGGRLAPEGDYVAVLTVDYLNGKSPTAQSPRISLDISAPTATAFADLTLFAPNPDSFRKSVTVTQDTSKESDWKATIRYVTPPAGTTDPVVRSFSWSGAVPKTVVWDGTNSQGIVVPDGKYQYQLSTVDAAGNPGGSAPALIEVDNRPTPVSLKSDPRYFSPGTSSKQSKVTFTPTVLLSDGIESWQMDVKNAANQTVRTIKGGAKVPATIDWDGKTDASALSADADYTAFLTVNYLKGNRPVAKSDVFTLDTKAPQVSVSADYLVFSPDGSSTKPVLKFHQTSSQEDLWEGDILDASSNVLRKYYWRGNADDFAWDGRDDNGNREPDGQYRYVVSASDKAGNTARQELRGIVIDTRSTSLLLSTDSKGFAPGTGRANVATISFKPILGLKDGVVGWTLALTPVGGTPQRTLSGTGLPPDTITWDGTKADKTIAPEGKYEAVLSVEYQKGNKPEARSSIFALDTSAPRALLNVSPRPFSPDGDGVDDEVTIGVTVDDLSSIGEWRLDVLEPTVKDPANPQKGEVFASFSGTGLPSARIVWNGLSNTGKVDLQGKPELVQAAEDYPTVLTITDSLGNTGAYRDAVSVDVLVIRDGDKLRIRVPGINFPADSPDLNAVDADKLAQNNRTLDRLAEILKKYSSYAIVVEGHANITQYQSQAAADNENQTQLIPLSLKRAQAVKDALAKRGISASRMSIIGVGGSRPIVRNDDLPNVWKNRRVEFILQK